MDKNNLVQQKLSESLNTIREAIDISADIKAVNGDKNTTMLTELWESFLKQFFTYVKQKSNETGHNLMAGISWNKIKP